MAKQNFKELEDGRYRLNLPEDIRQVLIDAIHNYRKSIDVKMHENFLADEAITALSKTIVKMRKSEFFLVFSAAVQCRIDEGTQNLIHALLDIDKVARKMTLKLHQEVWSRKYIS